MSSAYSVSAWCVNLSEIFILICRYGRGMYVNEAWKDNPYWREDFWGSNYDRLLSVKLRFDPKNFFTCHHCVGSEHLPGPKDGTSVAARMAAPWLLVVLVMGLIR
ncbi:hypothetical protein DPMN_103601 [Dreissena polymorpha]|uniref:Berberine/berberine-like domain-containing protein n=1 Tax=Dreissena polymorpha TaxID=45954 RepID=A0A9D4K0Y8_DREPO|nr:hypothetical protein DPMN_103601 [Dreissena polymorpha]